MAKLNKTEIEAVASKTYNALRKVAEQKRQDMIKNYKGSETYFKVVGLASRRKKLEKELDEIKDSLYNIGKKINYYGFHHTTSVNEIKDIIINFECKFPEIPSIDEIRDDVIIAAIDKNFNVDKFIKNFIQNLNI